MTTNFISSLKKKENEDILIFDEILNFNKEDGEILIKSIDEMFNEVVEEETNPSFRRLR